MGEAGGGRGLRSGQRVRVRVRSHQPLGLAPRRVGRTLAADRPALEKVPERGHRGVPITQSDAGRLSVEVRLTTDISPTGLIRSWLSTLDQ